jgi:hypothetical protein
MPQPTQAGSSKVKVETPDKYLNFSIYFFLNYFVIGEYFPPNTEYSGMGRNSKRQPHPAYIGGTAGSGIGAIFATTRCRVVACSIEQGQLPYILPPTDHPRQLPGN